MARRASGNYLVRLSTTLMVIGYGSVLLNLTDIQFIVLGWADSMQPWIGLIIGTIGLAILLVPMILARRGGSVAPAQPFQQNYAAPQQQPYGTPAHGFPQQGFPQQGFPQQQQGFAPQQGFAQQPAAQHGFAQQPPAQPGFAQQQPFAQPGAQQPFPPQGPPQQYGQQPPFPQQGYGPQQ